MTFKLVLIIVAVVSVTVILFSVVRMYFLIQQSATLIEGAQPYERKKPDAQMRILVLGDSTAVGVGSEKREDTTAGRFGSLYPDAEIINKSVSGLKIQGLEDLIKEIDMTERYDIVLIQIGANDIIRQTSLEDIKNGINRILNQTEKFGTQVILLHSGDIGKSKFFPRIARPFLTSRSHKVREIYKEAADNHSARYVDLIDSPSDKLLQDDPQTYYARDYLHLTGKGYGLWFDEIEKVIIPQQ